ncbi:MAG: hypothetical protein JNL74_08925 [Fibrobacteres bacterium]|nr:hypothetical protein [Fibrobacterota bacterium]
MVQHYNQTDYQAARLTFRDFFVIFFTVSILAILVILRYGQSDFMETKSKSEKAVLRAIALEKLFYTANGRYGQLYEIGFVTPFKDNRVEFSVTIEERDFIIKADEAQNVDAFGDNVAGNEYYVGYSSGACEYSRHKPAR